MSAKPAAIPLFADAYLADTMHLSTEEHGAYLLLLMAAWRFDDCGLPNDDRKLARIVGLSPRRWAQIKDTILDFWTVEGERIFNARLRKERGYVVQKSESNRKNARKRWDQQDVENKQSGPSERISHRNAPPPPPIEEEEPIGSPSISREPMKRRASETNERAQGINPRSTGRNPRRMKADEPITLPDWLPSEQWSGFLEMRKRKGASPTPRALKLIIGKLEEMRKQGHDPGLVLDQSTVKNWTDVYPMKDHPNGNRPFTDQPRDTRDHFQRYLDRELEQCAAERAAGEAGRSDAEPPADLLRIPDRTAEP